MGRFGPYQRSKAPLKSLICCLVLALLVSGSSAEVSSRARGFGLVVAIEELQSTVAGVAIISNWHLSSY